MANDTSATNAHNDDSNARHRTSTGVARRILGDVLSTRNLSLRKGSSRASRRRPKNVNFHDGEEADDDESSTANSTIHIREESAPRVFVVGPQSPEMVGITERNFSRGAVCRRSASDGDLIEPAAFSTAAATGGVDPVTQLRQHMEAMRRTQQETLFALSELSGAVQLLSRTLTDDRRSREENELRRRQEKQEEAEAPEEEGMDRKQVRLDGLEVYAVVSAVTAGTIIAIFEGYQPSLDVVNLFREGNYVELIFGLVFCVSGIVGIVSGVHCIFVFSLVTMYGRTALGMDRDTALETFFGSTGPQRYRGFQSFVRSLYAFMVELIIVVSAKFPNSSLRLFVCAVATVLMHMVYRDTQIVMDKAGAIFAPAAAAPAAATTTQSTLRSSLDMSAEEQVEDDAAVATAAAAAFPAVTSGGKQRLRSSLAMSATECSSIDGSDLGGKEKVPPPPQAVALSRKRAARKLCTSIQLSATESDSSNNFIPEEKETAYKDGGRDVAASVPRSVALHRRQWRERNIANLRKRISTFNISAAECTDM